MKLKILRGRVTLAGLFYNVLINLPLRRYPHILLKRFFVFNYNFDTPQQSLSSRSLMSTGKGGNADPEALVIFPPEGDCEGGSMIEVHFKEVMCHAAVKLIQALEKQMDLCEEARHRNTLPVDLPLATIYEERDDIGFGNYRETVSNTTSTGAPVSSSSTSSSAAASSSAMSVKNKKGYKKKPAGRIRKWMGDLCMQVSVSNECYPLHVI